MEPLFAHILDWRSLALLVASQATPVLLGRAFGQRYAAPIDGGRVLSDGEPVFGSHKTWRGLIGGTVAAALVGGLLELGFLLGAAFGLIALLGDLVSSFAKRRLGRRSGSDVPLVDQIPEALLPMLTLYFPLGLNVGSLLGTVAVFAVLDFVVTRRLGAA